MEERMPDWTTALGPAVASALVHDDCGATDVVHVFGDFSFGECEQIESAIVETVRIGRRTICSLLGCTYIDAAGVRVLVRAREALGSMFTIMAPASGVVRRVLDLAQLSAERPAAA